MDIETRYAWQLNPRTWDVNTTEDFDKFLNEQLQKLQTDHIDFYLLHNLHSGIWEKMKSLKALEWGQKAIKSGRIKYFGFSIHDTFDTFKDVLNDYDWDFCQIQYNYMNEDVQVGTKGLEYAASKQIPVIVMEPLLGGALASFSGPIQKIWEEVPEHNPIKLALQWLWDKPESDCVLSGMSTMEHVKQNIELAKASATNTLTQKELNFIQKVVKTFKEIHPIPCTKCKYCIPCPVDIDIPKLLEMYNAYHMHESAQKVINRNIYTANIPDAKKASACISCKKCEEKMPPGHKDIRMDA